MSIKGLNERFGVIIEERDVGDEGAAEVIMDGAVQYEFYPGEPEDNIWCRDAAEGFWAGVEMGIKMATKGSP